MSVAAAICIAVLMVTPAITQPVARSDAEGHIGQAVRLMQSRLYAEAASEFAQALDIQPDNQIVRIEYATCLFAQEQNDEARKQFEVARQRLGDRPGLMYYLGRLDLRANHFDSAIRNLAPLESNPAFPDASLYLGLAYLSAGQKERAGQCLERAARNDPRNPEAHYRLARFYSIADRTKDADREYQLYREWTEYRRLVQQYAGECADALRTKPVAQARIPCQRIADPKDAQRLILLGQLYVENGAFSEAIEPFQQAARLAPDSFDAWQGLGLSFFRLRLYAQALAPLQKAAGLNPQFLDTLTLLASAFHALGDDGNALPVLERAHNLNPDDARIKAALDQLRARVKPKQ